MKNKLKKNLQFSKTNKDLKILSLFAQGNIAVYFIVYLQTVLINLSLSPFDLGKYSYYQSLLTLIVSVTSLTIYTAHLRFLGFVDTTKLLRFMRKALLISTFLFAIIVFVIWGEWKFLPFVALIWFNEQLYYYRSLTRIKLYTAMKFVQHLILIVLLGILLLLQHADYKIILLSTGIAYIATYAIFYFSRKKCHIEKRGYEEYSVRDIFKYCAPGAVSVVSIYLLASVDQIFIDTYLSQSDLSNYAMAIRTLSIIQLLTAVFMDYWPRFYFEKAADRDYIAIRRFGYLFKSAIAVFSVLCIILAVPIYYIMGAKAYIGQSSWIFSILVFGEIFRIAGSINMTYRSFTKQSIYNVAILGGLGLIKLAISYLFIERYGLVILIFTTVGCYITYWIISFFLSVRAERGYMLKR